ncbi:MULTISPECIES: DUF397 domain-containing protein [Actinomadura]|uniref:DUF397 domain-containing protein n=1 Tax=Actinomadura yumaensis TaxID=111807 RepID=A0ABW2CNF3_9ACTN|nr:DUF397 domain-containing protein [Actinomadura sp. J1-007]MWK36938.1 DUF397 domain-containing protein [Actinomadura sp. J1-007]
MIVEWRKSSYSGGVDDKACVELARLASGCGVRDSQDPEGGHLALSVAQLGVLLERVKDGQR